MYEILKELIRILHFKNIQQLPPHGDSSDNSQAYSWSSDPWSPQRSPHLRLSTTRIFHLYSQRDYSQEGRCQGLRRSLQVCRSSPGIRIDWEGRREIPLSNQKALSLHMHANYQRPERQPLAPTFPECDWRWQPAGWSGSWTGGNLPAPSLHPCIWIK